MLTAITKKAYEDKKKKLCPATNLVTTFCQITINEVHLPKFHKQRMHRSYTSNGNNFHMYLQKPDVSMCLYRYDLNLHLRPTHRTDNSHSFSVQLW